jgi:hypothetical protein
VKRMRTRLRKKLGCWRFFPNPSRANVTTTINIYLKMVTRDAEEAMKKLESDLFPSTGRTKQG